MFRIFIFIFTVLISVTGCDRAEHGADRSGKQPTAASSGSKHTGNADIDGSRIAGADQEPQNWLSHGRTYSEQRFSPLDLINENNIEQLGLAWSLDIGNSRGLEATPLVVDGIMYTTGTFNMIHAIDAKTGKVLVEAGEKVTPRLARKLVDDGLKEVLIRSKSTR